MYSKALLLKNDVLAHFIEMYLSNKVFTKFMTEECQRTECGY